MLAPFQIGISHQISQPDTDECFHESGFGQYLSLAEAWELCDTRKQFSEVNNKMIIGGAEVLVSSARLA